MKTPFSIVCLVLALALFAPYPAHALFISDELTINFVPTDPIGMPSLTDGDAAIFQLAQVGDLTFINVIDEWTVPSLAANTSSSWYDIAPVPIYPPDPCFFSFTGLTNGFITQAFAPGATPVDPTTPPPAIDIGTFGADLTPLSMTGPIFAFAPTAPTGPISPLDATTGIQVGTWEVTLTAIAEPSTFLLLGAGLVGLGLVIYLGRRFNR